MESEAAEPQGEHTDEWIEWWFAADLIEHGHTDVVRRLAAAGDGFCAVVLAYDSAAAGDQESALAVLEPFVADGWWGAIETAACVLSDAGRGDEAVALCLPSVENGVHRTVKFVADLLLRHGRGDEAFALVLPRIAEVFYLHELVTVSAGLGRDEEVLAILDTWVDPRARDCTCGRGCGTDRPAGLIATVLERQGRIDEAVDLLQEYVHRRGSTSVNVVEQLAGVLARHDRHVELRALIDGYGKEYAARRFALHLESVGDVEGARAVLEPLAAGGNRNPSMYLAEILIRAGHGDEALDVLRRALPADPECLLDWWADLSVERGRVDEALAVVDEMIQGPYGLTESLHGARLCLLVHAGREAEAIEAVFARSEDEWQGADAVAETLAAVGRTDQAVEVLERARDREYFHSQMATFMLREGRVEEALSILPRAMDRQLHRPYKLAIRTVRSAIPASCART